MQERREAETLRAHYPSVSMVPPNPTEAEGRDAAAGGEQHEPPQVPFNKPGAVDVPPGGALDNSLNAPLQGLTEHVSGVHAPSSAAAAAEVASAAAEAGGSSAGDLLSALSTDPSILSTLLGSVSPGSADNHAPTPPGGNGSGFNWGPPAAPYATPQQQPQHHGAGHQPQYAPHQHQHQHQHQPHYQAHHQHHQQPQPPQHQHQDQRRGRKPCVFFNSREGCRNGARCGYIHDPSFRPPADAYPGARPHGGAGAGAARPRW